MSMTTTNGLLACEPFPQTSIETKTQKGFTRITTKAKLVATRLVFDYQSVENLEMNMPEGATVYVNGESLAHEWASRVFELEGKPPFVLVPFKFVVAAEEPP